ncbi:MAG: siroheme synthase [Firmicutes bacterium]|nr:siroheme synthase [Bacillota bacterium]
MAYYPVNLHAVGRRCLVFGGGTVAERKVSALLAAGAIVTVCSPTMTPLLLEMAASNRVSYINSEYRPGLAHDCFIVICATDDQEVNLRAAKEASAEGALVNVVDSPEFGDFSVPAQVVRGDLVLTVSTGGKSPALAAWVKRDLEKRYGTEYELYLELISRLRREVKARLRTSGERQSFWRESLNEEIFALLAAGRLDEAEEKIRNAFGCTGIQS